MLSVLDCYRSRKKHWRTLSTELVNLGANTVFSAVFAMTYHPDCGGYGKVSWRGYAVWLLYLPFMYAGAWFFKHSGVGPDSTSRLPVNVEYVSERFGLLVIITCGESLFAAVSILADSDSFHKLVIAFLSMYYALLIKLLYFELQSNVSKHAMEVSHVRGLGWTLIHIPVFVCAAGAGGVLHWANKGDKWSAKERHLFIGFTVVELLSLSLVSLFHGKIHNDENEWWTKKKVRIFVRLLVSAALVLGVLMEQADNIYTLLYACALVTVDFCYEFIAKRQIYEEHKKEEVCRGSNLAQVAEDDDEDRP